MNNNQSFKWDLKLYFKRSLNLNTYGFCAGKCNCISEIFLTLSYKIRMVV